MGILSFQGPNWIACLGGVRNRESELHRLPLYCYCGETLASRHEGRFFHLAFEGEVSVWGPGRGAGGELVYDQAVFGGRN